MKILYAIQGTGNGHLARALEIIPILKKMGETDILVSGMQSDIDLPFDVKFRFYGLSFIFGKKGGVDFFKTALSLKLIRFFRDIFHIPLEEYDLILNDFEPVSAWACKFRGLECKGISHQNATLHPSAPRPSKTDWLGRFILKYYAPASIKYGFHFRAFDSMHFTPVIRKSIRKSKPSDDGHYSVYLPAYSDAQIIKMLSFFSSIRWEVFSKKCKSAYIVGNIHFRPISLEGFNRSFIHCAGILCNAGFETPAEALFMGKKLCVVPMKNQYEQACNATLLSEMGIRVIQPSDTVREVLTQWISDKNAIRIDYPDETRKIITQIVSDSKKRTSSYRSSSGNKILMPTVRSAMSSLVSSYLHQRHL